MRAFLCLPTTRWASVAVLPFAVLIFSLAYGSGGLARLLSAPLLVLFGGASYAVYLFQVPVRNYTWLLITKLPYAPRDLDGFLSPVFLLLFSIIIFLFWEEPSTKFLRKLLCPRLRSKMALPAGCQGS